MALNDLYVDVQPDGDKKSLKVMHGTATRGSRKHRRSPFSHLPRDFIPSDLEIEDDEETGKEQPAEETPIVTPIDLPKQDEDKAIEETHAEPSVLPQEDKPPEGDGDIQPQEATYTPDQVPPTVEPDKKKKHKKKGKRRHSKGRKAPKNREESEENVENTASAPEMDNNGSKSKKHKKRRKAKNEKQDEPKEEEDAQPKKHESAPITVTDRIPVETVAPAENTARDHKRHKKSKKRAKSEDIIPPKEEKLDEPPPKQASSEPPQSESEPKKGSKKKARRRSSVPQTDLEQRNPVNPPAPEPLQKPSKPRPSGQGMLTTIKKKLSNFQPTYSAPRKSLGQAKGENPKRTSQEQPPPSLKPLGKRASVLPKLERPRSPPSKEPPAKKIANTEVLKSPEDKGPDFRNAQQDSKLPENIPQQHEEKHQVEPGTGEIFLHINMPKKRYHYHGKDRKHRRKRH